MDPDLVATVRAGYTLNRHGLVAGATGSGSGKTVTLEVLAGQLSDAGVPVFLSDVKGDVSGMAVPGTPGDKLARRTAALGPEWTPRAFPTAAAGAIARSTFSTSRKR